MTFSVIDNMPLPLHTQEQFEQLWFHRDSTKAALEGQRLSDKAWIVYFGAKWCGPCKRLDVESIQKAALEKGIHLWKCDVDENDYTPGYCQVRSIPAFVCFTPGTIMGTLQSANTEAVIEWIQTF